MSTNQHKSRASASFSKLELQKILLMAEGNLTNADEVKTRNSTAGGISHILTKKHVRSHTDTFKHLKTSAAVINTETLSNISGFIVMFTSKLSLSQQQESLQHGSAGNHKHRLPSRGGTENCSSPSVWSSTAESFIPEMIWSRKWLQSSIEGSFHLWQYYDRDLSWITGRLLQTGSVNFERCGCSLGREVWRSTKKLLNCIVGKFTEYLSITF